MNSKATVSSAQLIICLIILRVAFSTNDIAGISPGTSVQDILFAVPVVFIINLIIALPIFMLLKRHPDRDLMECSTQIFGKGIGFVICIIYFCFFLCLSSIQLGTFQMCFQTVVLSQTGAYIIGIPILIVCIYGAIKGIESITRFGVFVFVFYLAIMLTIFVSTLPNLELNYLKPFFYEGPNYFLQAVLADVNSSTQILFIAMCVPFLKPGTKIVKTFITWNALSMLLLFALEFFVVCIMGPFVSKQLFPLVTLSMISKVTVFQRIDNLDMISWIFNSILNICICLFFASQCIMRTPLRKWRRTIIIIASVLILIIGSFYSKVYLQNLNIYNNALFTTIFVLVVICIPLTVLITDVVKGKEAKNEEGI
jgi:spore germination protein KB